MKMLIHVEVEAEGQSLAECLDRYAPSPLLPVQRIIYLCGGNGNSETTAAESKQFKSSPMKMNLK